ncbi:MAG: transglycosylase SLT domain-containing protein [Gammaproteobacteria bacterium]
MERNFGHVQDFDYVGTVRYIAHIHERLPAYEPLFKEAAAKTGLDWRLLAAMGYQESHWNPKAISPTGVRGIMMLTRKTMAYLGLDNRVDPEQSIEIPAAAQPEEVLPPHGARLCPRPRAGAVRGKHPQLLRYPVVVHQPPQSRQDRASAGPFHRLAGAVKQGFSREAEVP